MRKTYRVGSGALKPGSRRGLSLGPRQLDLSPVTQAFPEYPELMETEAGMRHIVKVDAKGKEEVREVVWRYNAERRRIEDESATRTGRPPSGIAVRMIAFPLSAEQAAAQAKDEDAPR